jgi:tuberous sclerosis protein 2
MLQHFHNGITKNKDYHRSLENLTLVFYEMHKRNSKKCSEILFKLSHISLGNMAQPILELLSNASELSQLLESDSFTDKEFISVAAIALKYTDPLKFSPNIILLAHYVICLWFLKCRIDLRKSYASFTIKGLQHEVVAQLDQFKASANPKSPIKQDELQSVGDNRTKRVNTADSASMKKIQEDLSLTEK